MNTNSSGERLPERPERTDGQLDALLEDFFEHELPVDLRRRPSERLPVSFGTEPRLPSKTTVIAGLAAVATVLGLTFSALIIRPSAGPPLSAPKHHQTDARPEFGPQPRVSHWHRRRPTGEEPQSVRRAALPWKAASVDAPPPTVEYAVIEQVDPVQRITYTTIDGPVEQRTDVRTTDVSVYEPESGAQLDLRLSELTIEVIPVKEKRRGRPVRSLPERTP